MLKQWESRPLADLVEFHSGGTPSKAVPEYWGGPIPWVTVKDMKTMRFSGTARTLTELGATRVTMTPKGSVLVLVRGMGLFKDLPVVLCDEAVAFNQDIKSLVPRRGVDGEFLAFALISRKNTILRHVDSAGHGTGRLDTELLRSTRLPVPSLPKQRKIATVLRTWDEAIDKLEALRVATQRRYVALTNTLFRGCHPSAGCRPPTWCEYRLGEIFRERAQRGVARDKLLSITMNDGIIDRQEVGRKDTSAADKSNYKLILPGDIGYNTMRMWQGVSGLSTLRGIVSPAYTIVTPARRYIVPRYAAHLFKSRRMVFEFGRYSQGLTSDTWSLKYAAFAAIKVYLPPLREQAKLGALFDSVDSELTVAAHHVEALARQKQGLIERLLTETALQP